MLHCSINILFVQMRTPPTVKIFIPHDKNGNFVKLAFGVERYNANVKQDVKSIPCEIK